MAEKKSSEKTRKTRSVAKSSFPQLQKEHPFETDSQLQNRYGKGREKAGSDGSDHNVEGNNH